MKAVAVLSLLGLLVTLHAPLAVAASGAGMECCPGGVAMACCPLSGSCSLRSCGAPDRESQPVAIGAFLVPASFAAIVPAAASLVPAGDASERLSTPSRIPDPPPRG